MAMKVKNSVITYTDVNQLKPHPRNPRTHTDQQINQIAQSIDTFGFTNPVLTDGKNNVLAGHGRLSAAKKLGMKTIPVIEIQNFTKAQIKAYLIADNKLAENAGWDQELLAIEMQEIQALDMNFDLSVLGFELPELDIFLSDSIDDDENELPIPAFDKNELVSQLGDLWQLGDHHLLCESFLETANWKLLMGRNRAHMIFADVPYNLEVKSFSGLGRVQHDEFAMASGEMSEGDFIEFLTALFFFLTDYSRNGSIHYICMDWRHQYELLMASRESYTELKNLCVWNKTNGGMGSFYRSKHELVYVFKHGDKPHINNVELGKHGRNRNNIWDYPSNNAFHKDRDQELTLHSCCKPIAMVADAMLDCTHRKHIVIDPCIGSGSTLLAGERTGRRVFGMELDPCYIDTTILRWQEETGKEAIHKATGKTYKQLKRVRKGVTHA